MSKAEAAEKLLRHGPLTAPEFQRITRWPRSTCANTLARLVEEGRVHRELAGRHPRYQVAA